jgi:thioredoxin-dependent peroxiredoxin
MLKAGDSAPPFSAKDHRGKEFNLADQRGKTVVLWFYPKADTPGCTKEGCSFRDLESEFRKKNAVIYGASFDTPEDNRAFAEKFSFEFPLLSIDNATAMAYGAADAGQSASARRVGVVIDAEGKIKEYLPKVDAATYPTDVLSRI